MKREILKRLAACILYSTIVISTFAMVMFAGEVYLRWRADGIDPYWPSFLDPVAGWVFKPHSEVSWTNNVDFWTRTTSNEEGFLDRELPSLESVKDVYRIAVVGDSFVEAAQVAIQDKVHIKLEEIINKRFQKNAVRTYAYGYSGTGQVNQIGFYDRFIKHHKPNAVVLVLVGNDFSDNSAVSAAIRNGWDPRHSPRPQALLDTNTHSYRLDCVDVHWDQHRLKSPPESPGNATLKTLTINSRLYRWLTPHLAKTLKCPIYILSGDKFPTIDKTTFFYQQLLERPDLRQYFNKGERPPEVTLSRLDGEFLKEEIAPFFEEGLCATGFGLDLWIKKSQQDNFRLVALLSHSLKGFYKDRFVKLLQERSIPYVDQEQYIVKNGFEVSKTQFQYDGHWTVQGHQWAAEALAEFFSTVELGPLTK